ncbi:MAG: hypothetical protein WD075_05130 [Rhodospirillales bacterium]
MLSKTLSAVIPAHAGIQSAGRGLSLRDTDVVLWTPVCTGVTSV